MLQSDYPTLTVLHFHFRLGYPAFEGGIRLEVPFKIHEVMASIVIPNERSFTMRKIKRIRSQTTEESVSWAKQRYFQAVHCLSAK